MSARAEYDELKTWAAKYGDQPFNMLALSTSIAGDASPLQVMKRLFDLSQGLLEERDKLRETLRFYAANKDNGLFARAVLGEGDNAE
jgi:hypothetical protein